MITDSYPARLQSTQLTHRSTAGTDFLLYTVIPAHSALHDPSLALRRKKILANECTTARCRLKQGEISTGRCVGSNWQAPHSPGSRVDLDGRFWHHRNFQPSCLHPSRPLPRPLDERELEPARQVMILVSISRRIHKTVAILHLHLAAIHVCDL
jgi:hypothetical protein